MMGKLSKIFLSLLLVCTIFVSVGCGNDDTSNPDTKTDTVVDNEKKDDKTSTDTTDNKKNESTDNSSTTKKTVKLLKRNGVEWKENTKINSKRGAKSYKVAWGDTLSLIARTWNVNCYKLAKYNGIKDINKIEVGQVIYNYAAK